MIASARVLVTGARFQPATILVRALHAEGAVVHGSDPYPLSPALHSRALHRLHHVPAPSREPLAFVDAVAAIVSEEAIDLVIPSYEEGFYLARYRERIPATLFTSPFEVLERLHNKLRFLDLCRELSLPTPTTLTARSREELALRIAQFERFVARPAYSRGGLVMLTNHGPRASQPSLEGCEPTPENPWLVQEFVEGHDACSFSIVHEGRILVHCTYEPTLPAPGGWSIGFRSIDDFGTQRVASTIAAHQRYSGCLGLDFRRTEGGFCLIECNPRTSAGAFLIPQPWIGQALLHPDPSRGTQTVPAGVERQYDALLLDRQLLKLPPRELIRRLFTTPDAFLRPDDLLPSLCYLVSQRHWSQLARREQISAGQAFLEDLSWDGSPLP